MWRVALTVPAEHAGRFADLVEPLVDAISTFELEEHVAWLVEGTSYGEPDLAELNSRVAVLSAALGIAEPALQSEELPAIDWVTQTQLSFPPIRVARFFVHGSHHRQDVPGSVIGLQIEAAMAFGSGEHATTQGCLIALSDLAKRIRVRRALDMGCGSGILAFAIARLWHAPATGVDIDFQSVVIANENARLNRVQRLVRCYRGPGYQTPEVTGRYDLIVANILARPLARMAKDLRRHLAPGGRVVLSGLLHRHEPLVLAAHRMQGLRLERRYRIGDWAALVLRAGR